MLRLPPHAVALLCAPIVALPLVGLLFSLSILSTFGIALALTAAALMLCPCARLRLVHQGFALALFSLSAALLLTGHAHAAAWDVAGSVLAVPLGDLAIEAAKFALALIIPPLVGWIGVEVGRLFPALRKQLTDDRIDRMVRLAGDFALAAAEGCARGRTVPVDLRSTLVANAVDRAVKTSPVWQVAAAGGVQGIAEKVFRDLPLDPGASAENTLRPALVQLGVKVG